MRTVGIKVLKNRLSEYVRAASGGERVLVTDRDRIVAELNPYRPRAEDGRLTDEDFVELGVREGWLTPARTRGPLPDPVGDPLLSPGRLMEDLARDREDR